MFFLQFKVKAAVNVVIVLAVNRRILLFVCSRADLMKFPVLIG